MLQAGDLGYERQNQESSPAAATVPSLQVSKCFLAKDSGRQHNEDFRSYLVLRFSMQDSFKYPAPHVLALAVLRASSVPATSRLLQLASCTLRTLQQLLSILNAPSGRKRVSSTRFKLQWQAFFDAIPRCSLCFSASLGFSSLHGNISCAGYCFNDSITDRRNRHNLPLNAYVFRFGVTRRHSVSNPRIPAK